MKNKVEFIIDRNSISPSIIEFLLPKKNYDLISNHNKWFEEKKLFFSYLNNRTNNPNIFRYPIKNNNVVVIGFNKDESVSLNKKNGDISVNGEIVWNPNYKSDFLETKKQINSIIDIYPDINLLNLLKQIFDNPVFKISCIVLSILIIILIINKSYLINFNIINIITKSWKDNFFFDILIFVRLCFFLLIKYIIYTILFILVLYIILYLLFFLWNFIIYFISSLFLVFKFFVYLIEYKREILYVKYYMNRGIHIYDLMNSNIKYNLLLNSNNENYINKINYNYKWKFYKLNSIFNINNNDNLLILINYHFTIIPDLLKNSKDIKLLSDEEYWKYFESLNKYSNLPLGYSNEIIKLLVENLKQLVLMDVEERTIINLSEKIYEDNINFLIKTKYDFEMLSPLSPLRPLILYHYSTNNIDLDNLKIVSDIKSPILNSPEFSKIKNIWSLSYGNRENLSNEAISILEIV